MSKIDVLKKQLDLLLQDGICQKNYVKALEISRKIDKYVTKELKKQIEFNKR